MTGGNPASYCGKWKEIWCSLYPYMYVLFYFFGTHDLFLMFIMLHYFFGGVFSSRPCSLGLEAAESLESKWSWCETIYLCLVNSCLSLIRVKGESALGSDIILYLFYQNISAIYQIQTHTWLSCDVTKQRKPNVYYCTCRKISKITGDKRYKSL